MKSPLLQLFVLFGGFLVIICLVWGIMRGWERLTGKESNARELKELRWYHLVIAGAAGAGGLYLIKSLIALQWLSGRSAAEIVLGTFIGVPIFGVLGGLLLRKAGFAGYGQMMAVIATVMGAGAALVDIGINVFGR